MPPSWSERMEARLARLEERLAAIETAVGIRPAGLDELMDEARAQLAGTNDNAADD